MKKILSIIIFSLLLAVSAKGQSAIVREFKPVCDSLATLIEERNTIDGKLTLQAVMKRGSVLDFYFTESLGDYPWREEDIRWFRTALKNLFPDKYRKFSLGEIYSKRVAYSKLTTPPLGFDGTPTESKHSIKNPHRRNMVVPINGLSFDKGLDGRHIALWQSHGYYYDNGNDRWMWQRPCLFQTVEDMYTQSYVLPFLVPMLENAGAYVLIPRERDIQTHEVIVDNNEVISAYGSSEYAENGKWKDAGTGFAALKEVYTGTENPFTHGTARQIECIQHGKKDISEVIWRPEIPERGEYAVYVSYKTTEKSTSAAHYTVYHLGGKSDFAVNQKIGGSTWIYLGTFEFAEGSEGYVRLTNETPEGFKHSSGSVVSADAVRFGGGMGNIARGPKDSELEWDPVTSGMPRSVEGARYWLQWAGAPKEIYSQNEDEGDYRDDFMSRGDWVEWISRGSGMNPGKKGPGVPVDLSLGFHSDAGFTPDSSTVGTLAIYTLKSEGTQKLPSGDSRMTSREYADIVQSQIVNDLRAEYDSLWNRRSIWDRGYRESRTPSSPSMLLELLSHQNFADMKYGLDPGFRFTVGRAVYKGMLKYLSNRYRVPYAVQPLPVGSMGVSFAGSGKADISWVPTTDRTEPTAQACGFILYTRIDDGAFDTGVVIGNPVKKDGKYHTSVSIRPGHIYSFRIAAYNDGGKSFASETVSIGMPAGADDAAAVLVVNNFDRISGPAFIDTPSYAGFDSSLDGGVPYIKDISYVGDMYEFRRDAEFVTNDNPGFGASFSDYAGKAVAGNTFDYAYCHGKSIMKAGHPFFSCSNEAFCTDTTFRSQAWTVDLICGKQVTTAIGSGMAQRYSVFPEEMQEALTDFTAAGGNVLASGAYIGTDIWDSIYPVDIDEATRAAAKKFATGVLGYRWAGNSASRKASARFIRNKILDAGTSTVSVCSTRNPQKYCVESPDGINPSSKNGCSIMRYTDTGISAGICHEGRNYRTVCLGFPIEALEAENDIDNIISLTLEFFKK